MRRKKRSSMEKRKSGRVIKRLNKKLTVVFVLFFLLLFALVIRLTYITLVEGDEYTLTVLEQNQTTSTTIAAERGEILDSNGVVLATSTKVYTLIIDAKVILSYDDDEYIDETLNAISECYGYTYDELLSVINTNSTSSYIVLEDTEDMDYDEVEPFEELEEDSDYIVGVWFEESYQRNYPYSSLASDIIGFTSSDGSGAIGLEAYYDDYLTGTDGREFSYVDDNNESETVLEEATDGDSLVTSIDYNVQSIVEKYIEEYSEEYDADNIAVVIADPDTGEIIAMADSESFDLNDPRDLTDYYTDAEIEDMSDDDVVDALNEIWKCYAVSTGFEPGSTFKPFTVAAALESGVIEEDDTFVCNGSLEVSGYTISCHNTSGHGKITVTEALAYSCNVALMKISAKLGDDLFSYYREMFGFNQLTNIDLPSEVSCASLVHEADDMDDTDLATYAFGQNFKITMVQMVAAFSSLINGGYYYQPHLVTEITDSDGSVIETIEPTLVSRTVSSDTSDFIKQALREVVTDGTGYNAAVDGYLISGKTGTAEIGDTDDDNDYVLSFIGFAPYDDPEVVCYVIFQTKGEGSYASLLWSDIMTEVLPYLNIMPDDDSDDD